MISVQNLLRRSSGNSLLCLALVVCLCFGCSALQSSQQKQGSGDRPREAQHPQVYNPTTGKYEPVENPRRQVDTIRFTEEKASTPPVGETPGRKSVKKDQYDVAFLMPFDAAKNTTVTSSADARVRRFVHYYAGVKMALDDLRKEGISINATVYDTKENATVSKSMLQKIDRTDAVVGPYEVEGLREAAAFASRKRIPVFSPWTPSIVPDDNSPYFVQLNPGMEAHADAIMQHVSEKFPGARVYLVARDDARERGRIALFREAASRHGIGNRCEDFIINDTSADLAKTNFQGKTSRQVHSVFVLPHFSRNDEDFLNAFLRKLHAEKSTHPVSVYGLPQWMSFNKLNADYLESTNVYITTTQYVDYKDSGVREFQRSFFDLYGTIAEPSAYHGYTFTLFLGRALHKHGTGFLDAITDLPAGRAGEEYRLVSCFRNPVPERNNIASYIENRAILVLRFVDHAYRRS